MQRRRGSRSAEGLNKMSKKRKPQWYVAEIVMEIMVKGESRNVVHLNLVLLLAPSAESAYKKALRLGKRSETSYENPAGRRVSHRFRGIASLEEMYEPLKDGSEITFRQFIGLKKSEVGKLATPQEKLGIFRGGHSVPRIGPDYRSAEILREVRRRTGK